MRKHIIKSSGCIFPETSIRKLNIQRIFDLLPTNSLKYCWNASNSPYCRTCLVEFETQSHFFHCPEKANQIKCLRRNLQTIGLSYSPDFFLPIEVFTEALTNGFFQKKLLEDHSCNLICLFKAELLPVCVRHVTSIAYLPLWSCQNFTD